jgi:hypothetical protein
MALQSTNADEKVLKFVNERFPEVQGKDEKKQQQAVGVKLRI